MGGFFSMPSGLNFGSALGGAASALGGMFPTSSTTTMNGTQDTTSNQTTNPLLSQANQNFLNQLMGQYSNLMSPFQTSGYQAQQGNVINQNSNALQQQTQQELAARGLSTSPVAASIQANQNQARIGQLNTLSQQMPLLANQMNLQNLNAAAAFQNTIPKGSTSTGNQNTTTNSTQKTTSGGGIGGLLGGIGGALGGLFSDERLKKDIKEVPVEDSIKILAKIKPITYNWKENDEPATGFSAQNIKKVLPKTVVKDKSGFHRMDMIAILPHLVNAVNKLHEAAA
jgi:Chaperone of endosialidase